MKAEISKLLETALGGIAEFADSPEITSISATVERARDARHGDFATNVAMRLAKSVGQNPLYRGDDHRASA